MSTATDTGLTVGVWQGLAPRLLRPATGVESSADYRASGGMTALPDTAALLAEIERAGLQGRGGAAFPMAVKLATVRRARERGSDTVVVANGEEGEPASVKDRWLLRHRPHLVLDGLRLAARVVDARHGHVYLSDARAEEAVNAALAEPDSMLDGLSITVHRVAAGYVAGEESAAVRAINGGPAKPTDKPPRVFAEGVGGLPTLVSNVETLANLPFIAAHGGAAFRAVGTDDSPGSFLSTVTGGGRPTGLYELPLGVPVRELLALHGIPEDQVRGAVMGGYFTGMLDRRQLLDVTLDHASLRAAGCGLGCGAVSVITDECPVAVAAALLEYYDRENAGQCGSCFNGTAAMAAAASALRDGDAADDDVSRLLRWSQVLRGRGACATLDAATNIAASLLAVFPDDVDRHVRGRCSDCADHAYRALRPFEVEAL